MYKKSLSPYVNVYQYINNPPRIPDFGVVEPPEAKKVAVGGQVVTEIFAQALYTLSVCYLRSGRLALCFYV